MPSELSTDPHSRAALPLAPSLDPTLAAAHMPRHFRPLERRVLWICLLAMLLGSAVALVARLLTALIGLVTNLAFYGRISTEFSSPAGNHLGLWVIAVPVIGGLIVGAMARWGSRAIRGHGIPEAMEQVLLNESRIPPRITWLKPVSSAIAIGTGGPFGAEGPIIATGREGGEVIHALLLPRLLLDHLGLRRSRHRPTRLRVSGTDAGCLSARHEEAASTEVPAARATRTQPS